MKRKSRASSIRILQRYLLCRTICFSSVKVRFGRNSSISRNWLSPANPSLRDLTERILIAGKGRFDRALHWKRRRALGLPWESTIAKDDFLAWTLDTWEIRPEQARRVGHPAPFPVELPRRLIELYTYRGDVVLDPFMGAGSTAVAAVQSDRRYVGFDTEPEYVASSGRPSATWHMSTR